jgi:hypothetical protein
MPRTKKALLDWKAHLEYMRHRRKIAEIKSDHVFCRLRSFSLFDGQRIMIYDEKLIATRHDTAGGYATLS